MIIYTKMELYGKITTENLNYNCCAIGTHWTNLYIQFKCHGNTGVVWWRTQT